jgi:DNA-binding XRE family transcriptional regulator
MNAIIPIEVTHDTVTLRRGDFEAMTAAIEEAGDVAFLEQVRAREAELGVAAARADYLAIELVERLLAGESPVAVWRDHRQVSQTDLAAAAGVSRSYLAEVEAGRKPGSVALYQRLAAALRCSIDDLVPALADA